MSQTILDLVQVSVPLVAAVVCWLVSMRAAMKREQWSWRLLSLAHISVSLSWVVRAYYHLLLAVEAPELSAADAAWALHYPLAFAGLMLQIPRKEGRIAGLSSLLDAVLFTLGVAGLSWSFTVAPSLAGQSDRLVMLATLSKPLGDLALTFVVILLVLRWSLQRVPLSSLCLVVAFVIHLLAANLANFGAAKAVEGAGNLLGLLWLPGYVAIGVAAMVRLRNDWVAQATSEMEMALDLHKVRDVRAVLPYLVPTAAALLLALDNARSSAEEAKLALIPELISAAVVLAMSRLVLAKLEVGRQGTSFSEVVQQLETQAVQRTVETTRRSQELSTLNRMVTQLGQCQTAGEALSVGLELASDAFGLPAGVVWTLGPDGRVDLAAQRGLTDQVPPSIADLPKRAPALGQILSSGRPTLVSDPELLSHPAVAGPFSRTPSGLLIVPLLSRRTLMGAIGLVSYDGTRSTESEVQLAQIIGAQVGMAFDNVRRYEDARYLAERDPVTGLLNHRAIHDCLEREFKRAQRAGQQLSVLMMDLDNFKLLNDTYGHPAGDQMLQTVALVLLETARDSDSIGRYGGDEFMAVLPETGTEGAIALAERFRARLAEQAYVAQDRSKVPIQMSFGVATYPENSRGARELVQIADANLYRSKQNGGDTVAGSKESDLQNGHQVGIFGVLDGLVTAIDGKDHYTRKHSEDVTSYALAIARALGFSRVRQRTLRTAGLLHDVGKIGIPDNILRKPGRVDEEELAIVRHHVQLGEIIIKEVPNTSDVQAAVGSHHEWVDGRGYPRGLKKDEIPLAGRILAVADTYSAMTTNRPYRKAMSPEEARQELLRVAGTQLDPELVEKFLKTLQEKGPAIRAAS